MPKGKHFLITEYLTPKTKLRRYKVELIGSKKNIICTGSGPFYNMVEARKCVMLIMESAENPIYTRNYKGSLNKLKDLVILPEFEPKWTRRKTERNTHYRG